MCIYWSTGLQFAADIANFTGSNLCADATACAEVLDYNGANRRVRWSSSLDITHVWNPTDGYEWSDRRRPRFNSHRVITWRAQWSTWISMVKPATIISRCLSHLQLRTRKRIHLNYKGTQVLKNARSWLVRWILSRLPMLQGLHWVHAKSKMPCSLDDLPRDTKNFILFHDDNVYIDIVSSGADYVKFISTC